MMPLRLTTLLAAMLAVSGCMTPRSTPVPSRAVADARAHKDVTPEATCPDLEPTVSVGFPFNESAVPDTAFPVLQRTTRALACHPQIHGVVVGEADAHGTPEDQKKLSQARIEAVIAYFTAHGVAATRFSRQVQGKAPTPGDQQMVIMAEGRRW